MIRLGKLISLLLPLCTLACNDVEFGGPEAKKSRTEAATPSPRDDERDEAELASAEQPDPEGDVDLAVATDPCQADDLKTKTFALEFPDVDNDPTLPEGTWTCPWGEGDNLPFPDLGTSWPSDPGYTARIEQKQRLDLPEGKVCNMSLDFEKADDDQQPFFYDDEVMLTFGPYVLMTSAAFPSEAKLKKSGRFFEYSWDKILSSKPKAEVYCVDGSGSCELPVTQTEGGLAFSASPETISEVVRKAARKGESYFRFITFGDNDFAGRQICNQWGCETLKATDCRHKPVSFRVTVTYAD